MDALQYTDDRLGFYMAKHHPDPAFIYDEAYMQDEFGELHWVPFTLPQWYFQEH